MKTCSTGGGGKDYKGTTGNRICNFALFVNLEDGLKDQNCLSGKFKKAPFLSLRRKIKGDVAKLFRSRSAFGNTFNRQ